MLFNTSLGLDLKDEHIRLRERKKITHMMMWLSQLPSWSCSFWWIKLIFKLKSVCDYLRCPNKTNSKSNSNRGLQLGFSYYNNQNIIDEIYMIMPNSYYFDNMYFKTGYWQLALVFLFWSFINILSTDSWSIKTYMVFKHWHYPFSWSYQHLPLL